jgi:predicted exporter
LNSPVPRRAAWRDPLPWLWLALMALGLWLCTRANYVADLSAFLPAAPTAEQRVLLAQLRSGATARVLMIGLRGGEAPARIDASRRLAAALRESGDFESVHNGDRAGGDDVARLVFERRYLLSPGVDEQRFTTAGLRDAMQDTLGLLGTPAGALVKPLLWRDPTGEAVRLVETMQPPSAPRVEGGVWVSRVAPRAVLLATTRAGGEDLDAQARAQSTVRTRFAALQAPGVVLELSGPGVFAVEARETIRAEVERLSILGSLAMLALLVVAFGSLKPLGIAALPVASGVVAGIAAVSLTAGQVHGITLGFGATLIGEAVDYGIYYLVQARGLGREGWRREHWPTVRLGLLTSLAGFSTLVASGFDGLQQLGVFSLSGLLAAAATTRFVLPRLAPDGAPGLGLRTALGEWTRRASMAAPRWRRPLAVLTVAGVAVLLLHPTPWRGTLATLSPVPADGLALDALLRADLGAADVGTLVAVQGADEAGALEAAEQAGARLDPLVERGLLRGYQSPALLLPSPRAQRARQAVLPDAPTLRERVHAAADAGALPAARLEPFVEDVQAQRRLAPLTRADLQGTPLAGALDAQLVRSADGRGWIALLSLVPAADRHDAAAQALPVALAGLPNARVIRVQQELDAMYADYMRQARWQALAGALAVVALLAWHLRSAARLRRVLAPLAASVVLVLAGLTVAGVSLGVMHLVGLLLVMAIGSNYALFFDHLHDRGAAEVDTLASLLLANLTTVASFGLLATADVPALAALGRTVAPGALLSLLLSAAFCPPSAPASAQALVGQSPPA